MTYSQKMRSKMSLRALSLTSATLLLGSALAFSANAGTRSYSHMSSVSPSSVKIQGPGQSANEKSIILPYGKSSVIELPENLQDVIVSNPEVVELNETANGTITPGEIVNLMAIRGRDQVMLKVRIVEMQRSVSKQLGFNLGAVAQLGESTVSLVSSAGVSRAAGLAADATIRPAGGDLQSLTGSLQALERVGLIRTLAEPSLTAISGETANTLIGGEFPLLTNIFIDDNGQTQREFEFRPYGVSLGFTPVVLSEGLISLNISTEVSEPTTEGSFETGGVGSDILGLRVRRANTVVEMPAGGSLVIAGLIREENRSSSDGTPGIKDIPGLGALFRNSDTNSTQTELVIIVTPYLVDATHPDKLQTPLDGFVAPNDKSSVLLGRLNDVYAQDGKARISQPALGGPFGHVVD